MWKVWLVNSKNEELDITDLEVFLTNMEGLGVSIENEYLSVNGHSRLIGETIERQQLSGDLFISLGSFESTRIRNKLIKHLAFSPVSLRFQNDIGVYSRFVKLVKLSKNMKDFDLNEWVEQIELDFLSPWFNVKKFSETQDKPAVSARGWVFPFAWPRVFTTRADDKTNTFNISNDSIYLTTEADRMSPVVVHIRGYCKNPYWEVFQNSQLVASDGFSMTVTEGYELRVSSLFQDQHALLVSPDGVESSVYQQQDKTRSNFVHVPSGRSTIVVHCGNADCEVEVYEECDLI